MDTQTEQLIIPRNLKWSEIYVNLFKNMNWNVSLDKFGNLCFIVDKNKDPIYPPSTYTIGCFDYRFFVDGISYEEDSIEYLGKGKSSEFTYKVDGQVTLIMQHMIHHYFTRMVKNKCEFIIFPKESKKEEMINAIVNMFPNKYTREMLEPKKFVI